jgi:hypothetical protein
VGGSFIEFTESAGISLNPFSFVEDIDEDMELLQPLLAQMVSPREALDGFRYSTLGAAIKKVWKAKGRAMTITDIHALLATGRLDDDANTDAEGDRRLKDLAAMLAPYAREGTYGKYFDREASIDFSSDFIVLELEELKAKKDLQTVVLLIVMYRITREMYFTRDRKKIVIIDEAWDLLSGGATAEFIEAGYRRARKYKGAFMSATQGVDDYYRNPAAKAALDNSDWMFLLRQKPESIEMMDKLGQLTMDDAMKRLLQSLRTEHGAYSEVFIHSPAGNGVGRLIVDPYSLLLFSSRAEDFSAINAKRAEGLSVAGHRHSAGRAGAGVSRSELALIVGLNAALSLALVLAASWLLPASGQRFATVDIASLYRAKEGQVTAQLLRRDASDTDRAAALREAASFGEQLDRLVARLPADCRCLVFTQGALIGAGAGSRIADLTPQLRRQLGLEDSR